MYKKSSVQTQNKKREKRLEERDSREESTREREIYPAIEDNKNNLENQLIVNPVQANRDHRFKGKPCNCNLNWI